MCTCIADAIDRKLCRQDLRMQGNDYHALYLCVPGGNGKVNVRGSSPSMRRTASLETVYLRGQWPRDGAAFLTYCGHPLVHKATQVGLSSSLISSTSLLSLTFQRATKLRVFILVLTCLLVGGPPMIMCLVTYTDGFVLSQGPGFFFLSFFPLFLIPKTIIWSLRYT